MSRKPLMRLTAEPTERYIPAPIFRLDYLRYEDIARVCHEANRAYCRALGDTSHEEWDAAPEWVRDSAIKGVKHRLNNPYGTPQEQHEAWMAEKIADGWTYGPKKDAERKTHPCLLPYDQLPDSQRRKDALFAEIVLALTYHPPAVPPYEES